MKTVIENNVLPPESYVVEIDGKIRSVYRIFIEALKAGMELKHAIRGTTRPAICQNRRLKLSAIKGALHTPSNACPLYPQKRTSIGKLGMSALCNSGHRSFGFE
jgi:hypothetical protein